MSLIPWKSKDELTSPVVTMERSMSRLREEMDSLFDRFFGNRWSFGVPTPDSVLWPDTLRVDVSESDDEVTIKLEAPGVDPEDIDVSVSGQTLTVRGEKRRAHEDENRNYHYVERHFGSFQRNIPLPFGVDADRVHATFHHGVVTIQLPKRPEARPKRIPVTSR